MTNMLTEQQIQQFCKGLRVDTIPIRKLMELCLNPGSGITIDVLRNAGYPKIGELEELCIRQLPECGIYYKEFLLNDLKNSPSIYGREKMFDIISNNRLSRKDLVENNSILTDRAYEHIKRFPSLKDEQKEMSLSFEETYRGNGTDVYFIGLPDTGKTSVIAGLMSMIGFNGLEICRNTSKDGYKYAYELCNCVRSNLMLPRVAHKGIVTIDVQVKYECGTNRISLIDMTCEEAVEDLNKKTGGLFSNNNRKIIFFVIDPINEKTIRKSDGNILMVNQSDKLNDVVAVMSKNKSLLKRVDSICFILTKRDLLSNELSVDYIKEMLSQQGYSKCWDNIRAINKEYGVNCRVGYSIILTTFCLGKFMPGDVYEFDETDSLRFFRLLSSILPIPPSPDKSLLNGCLFGNLLKWLNS